jgi:hypothetical protein
MLVLPLNIWVKQLDKIYFGSQEGAVPRFYFDVREGASFTPDEEGLEFDSLDAAEREAAASALVRPSSANFR